MLTKTKAMWRLLKSISLLMQPNRKLSSSSIWIWSRLLALQQKWN